MADNERKEEKITEVLYNGRTIRIIGKDLLSDIEAKVNTSKDKKHFGRVAKTFNDVLDKIKNRYNAKKEKKDLSNFSTLDVEEMDQELKSMDNALHKEISNTVGTIRTTISLLEQRARLLNKNMIEIQNIIKEGNLDEQTLDSLKDELVDLTNEFGIVTNRLQKLQAVDFSKSLEEGMEGLSKLVDVDLEQVNYKNLVSLYEEYKNKKQIRDVAKGEVKEVASVDPALQQRLEDYKKYKNENYNLDSEEQQKFNETPVSERLEDYRNWQEANNVTNEATPAETQEYDEMVAGINKDLKDNVENILKEQEQANNVEINSETPEAPSLEDVSEDIEESQFVTDLDDTSDELIPATHEPIGWSLSEEQGEPIMEEPFVQPTSELEPVEPQPVDEDIVQSVSEQIVVEPQPIEQKIVSEQVNGEFEMSDFFGTKEASMLIDNLKNSINSFTKGIVENYEQIIKGTSEHYANEFARLKNQYDAVKDENQNLIFDLQTATITNDVLTQRLTSQEKLLNDEYTPNVKVAKIENDYKKQLANKDKEIEAEKTKNSNLNNQLDKDTKEIVILKQGIIEQDEEIQGLKQSIKDDYVPKEDYNNLKIELEQFRQQIAAITSALGVGNLGATVEQETPHIRK